MSRVAKLPITVPEGVEVSIEGGAVSVKGGGGGLQHRLNSLVAIEQEASELRLRAVNDSRKAVALAGTARAVLQNMIKGVSEGFQRKLEVVGVGYRAQAQGRTLNLTLGFSHPVAYSVPEGVSVETPSPTEILVKGVDKQQVGQVAAEIRGFRPPEPYKGKGVRYADERVIRKEAKKT